MPTDPLEMPANFNITLPMPDISLTAADTTALFGLQSLPSNTEAGDADIFLISGPVASLGGGAVKVAVGGMGGAVGGMMGAVPCTGVAVGGATGSMPGDTFVG